MNLMYQLKIKTFMPANVCYRASNKIKKLINENDLKYLVSTDKSI